MERVYQLVSMGAVNFQNWSEAWADAPKSLEEFETNFAIFEARLKEGSFQ